jgi:hypothetical protein
MTWEYLTKEEINNLFNNETKARGVTFMGRVHIELMLLAAQELLKEKNEKKCTGHRDEHGSRYDPFVRNSGH